MKHPSTRYVKTDAQKSAKYLPLELRLVKARNRCFFNIILYSFSIAAVLNYYILCGWKQHLLMSSQFCMSEAHTWWDWIPCSWSHWTEIKAFRGPKAHFGVLEFSFKLTGGRINFLFGCGTEVFSSCQLGATYSF